VERTEQKWGVAQSKERTTERTSQQEKKQTGESEVDIEFIKQRRELGIHSE